MINKINFKNIFCYLFVIFALSFSSMSFANYDVNKNGEECRSPTQFSKELGNQSSVKWKKACGFYLQQKDKAFITVTKFFLDRSDIENSREFLSSKGINVDGVIDYYDEKNFVKDVLLVVTYLIAFATPVYLSAVVISSFSTNFSMGKVLGIIIPFVILLSVALSSTTLHVKVFYFTFGTINHFHDRVADVEGVLEDANTNSAALRSSEELSDQNDKMVSFLLEQTIQEENTKKFIYSNSFANIRAEYDPNGSVYNLKRPSINQKLSIVKQCTDRNRVEVDTDIVIFIPSVDELLDGEIGVNLAHEGMFMYGGETDEWECENSDFGKQKGLISSVKISTANVIKNFALNTNVQNMANDTNVVDDFAGLFNELVKYLIQKADVADIDGSNSARMIESEFAFAKNASIEARKSNVSRKSTKSYKQLVSAIQRTMENSLSYEKNDNLTVDEADAFRIIQAGQFKFSKLFGHPLGQDEITYEDLNGMYYLKPYIVDIVNNRNAYLCSQRLSDTEFVNYVKYAEDFNVATSEPAYFLKSFGARGDLDCFVVNEDNTLTAVGNPNQKDEYKEKVDDGVNALALWLEAHDEAALNIINSNQSNHDDQILELINTYKPNPYDLRAFKIAQIDMYSGLSKTSNIQENVMTFNYVNSDNKTNEPSYYFNFSRFTDDDLDDEEKDSRAVVYGLKKYDYSEYLISTNRESSKNFAEVNDSWFDQFSPTGIAKRIFNDFSLCPIKDSDGNCVTSLTQQSHLGTLAALEVTSDIAVMRATLSGITAMCMAGDGANFDPKALIAGPAALIEGLATVGCNGAIAMNAGLGGFMDLGIVLSVFSAILGFLASNATAFIIVLVVIFFVRTIPTLFITTSIFFPYESTRNSVVAPFASNPNQSLVKFDATVGSLKTMIFYLLVVPISMYVFLYIMHDPTFGGIVYDTTASMFGDGVLSQMIMVIVSNFVMFGFVPVIINSIKTWESDTASAFNVNGEGFFTGQSQFVSGVQAIALNQGLNETKKSIKEVQQTTGQLTKAGVNKVAMDRINKKKASEQPLNQSGKRTESKS
ncbi:membrane hypothetical protein [Vibrio nigripulchritudo MADA3029]|uniref:hypothetical protein n=1 Tax=Vibrio nigripulchritudo TaxID=28173 RepID=UPI0003B23B96|nr:hypothetical protein [Vibrio nigripulchritudo]CCN49162.1 membrane hypothetical protein [Vibrio nigripulchritudo MADA3020]CCN54145.1 membrane hypothetical protein [Vibrio nigripulchritudo MADA3021]CCN61215.1 membrane hypothetical protein [Vibrio nigripulchritudo MADA3029]